MQVPKKTIQSKKNSQCKGSKARTSCCVEEQQRTSLEQSESCGNGRGKVQKASGGGARSCRPHSPLEGLFYSEIRYWHWGF